MSKAKTKLMPNPDDIYQLGPTWRPSPSPDNCKADIQAVLYEEDPQVRQLSKLPTRGLMQMMRESGYDPRIEIKTYILKVEMCLGVHIARSSSRARLAKPSFKHIMYSHLHFVISNKYDMFSL